MWTDSERRHDGAHGSAHGSDRERYAKTIRVVRARDNEFYDVPTVLLSVLRQAS